MLLVLSFLGLSSHRDQGTQQGRLDKEINSAELQQRIKWVNAISIIAIHLLALHSLFTVSLRVKWQSYLWGKCLIVIITITFTYIHVYKNGR
jgi:hypothetical protein